MTPVVKCRDQRFLLLLACSLACTIMFGRPSSASAQDLSGLSVCIDPGHGRGNTNQGPTGLREADINLSVSFFLKDFLKRANIDTVLLTRVDDSTNPTLSQREAIANTFGVDWFHSVHHNACGPIGTVCTARRTLLLIEEVRTFTNPCPDGRPRGTGQPEWPGLADDMSDLMASRIFQALRTTSFSTRLDWSFFGGCDSGFSLGVLNELLMPGELSEATFHQNRVEENKLRNPDFLKLEARALFMAMLDFYEAGEMTTGALAGIIRSDETDEPINGAEVVLNPTGATYTTDNNNNGLYVFHDLEPGTYQVMVFADEFESQSQTVDVEAHAFSFADFSLVSAAAPIVTNTLPTNNTQDYDVYEEIGVRFSRPMDRQSVEQAFSIGPPVSGHFIWSPNSDVVLFEPDVRFAFDTEYTVGIAATAQDAAGRALDGNGDGVGGDDFFFSFFTASLNDTKPVVLDFFPTRKDTAIFIKDVFWAQFNRELNPATIDENTVFVTAEGGADVEVQMDYVPDGSRRLTLIPKEALMADHQYFITLASGLRLMDGGELESSFRWQFTTQAQPIQIRFLDDFESSLLWTQPGESAATQGIDRDSTSLQLTPNVSVSEHNGAQLNYKFTSEAGFIQIDHTAQTNIDLEQNLEIGLYVYGDNSQNEIRVFLNDADGVEALPWTIINWSGWKLLRFALNQVQLQPGENGNGMFDAQNIALGGLQLNFRGQSKGQLFFDDVIETIPETPVSVEAPDTERQFPENFILAQNYPNPFNPETVIPYRIPGQPGIQKSVVLKIYNLQGQEIRSLINSTQTPGAYHVVWDGKNELGEIVSSGVYIYQITVDNLNETRRMMFLK